MTEVIGVTPEPPAPAASPIEATVKRYRCPFCARGWSRRRRAEQHIAHCWHNPAVRNCKTCVFFQQHMGEEDCYAGIDISDGKLPIGCAEWGGPR